MGFTLKMGFTLNIYAASGFTITVLDIESFTAKFTNAADL